jgi:hypothetical protein
MFLPVGQPVRWNRIIQLTMTKASPTVVHAARFCPERDIDFN